MAPVINTAVPQPVWNLVYRGKDITRRISPAVLSVTYTDNLEGQADEVEVVLEDLDHRWKNAGLPAKGDALSLTLGYLNAKLLDAGEYQIDEVEYNGPPDTVTIRALAAGVKPSLRTERSAAYEQTTLQAIATQIAGRHGLTLVGTVPAISFARVTQKKETDLAFLKRLGAEWGFVFNVAGKKLIWHNQENLDAAPVHVTLTRALLSGSYTFRCKSAQVYRACKVSYFSAKQKRDITHSFPAKGITTGDILTLVGRCESKAHAERKAMAALRNANGRQTEGVLTLYGDIRLRAGVNVTLSGWGQLDGDYQILQSKHTIERGAGYSTTVEFSMNGSHSMKELRNEKKLVKS